MPDKLRQPIVRTILGLTGLVALVTGANIAFGGIATLGLQGTTDFFQVTDPAAFGVKDNHVRYVGGLWFGIGLMFVCSAFWLDQLRQTVLIALAIMVLSGLVRLSAPDLSVLLSPDVIGSFLAEIIIVPILFWQVWLGGREKN